MIEMSIKKLVQYGRTTGLIEAEDEIYARNQILEVLKMSEYEEPGEITDEISLEDTLNALTDYAAEQGAILLNVGRGSTVDCLALADAVHSGHLFGAALDVTDPEPLPSDHPLWSEPNVIITPHISGRFSLAKTLDNIVEIFIHNLKLYAAGQPVDNQVSRTTHYVSGGSGGQRLVCGMP